MVQHAEAQRKMQGEAKSQESGARKSQLVVIDVPEKSVITWDKI